MFIYVLFNVAKEYRLFLQAWHSIREPNAITLTKHIYIPDIYKARGKYQVRFSRGSYKALIYIRTPFMLKMVIVFLKVLVYVNNF